MRTWLLRRVRSGKVPFLVSLALAGLLLSACGAGQAAPAGPTGPQGGPGPQGPTGPAVALAPQDAMAEAQIIDSAGKVVGLATFTQQSAGVVVDVLVTDLPAGPHGLHIHAAGKCEAPGFTTAAGHFNPEKKQHGLLSATGAHAGDLPNLVVAPNGTGSLRVLNARVTLDAGAAHSLLQQAGTALVVHAGPDDETTDPTGDSGARIACGPITKR